MNPPSQDEETPGEDRAVNRIDEEGGRVTAAQIQRQRPGWMIVYGCYSRRFVAFPLFAMRRRMIVVAAYPDALVARMDDVERQWRIPEPGPAGPEPQPGR